MEIKQLWRASKPFLRSACLTLMWVVLAIVVARQCETRELEVRVQFLEKRILDLETRPAVVVTPHAGKVIENGNDSRDHGGNTPDRR